MALPVYSTTFIRVNQAGGAPNAVYTVAVGFVAVIRTIEVVQVIKTVASLTFVATSTTGAVNVQLFDPAFAITVATAAVQAHWDGHVAIPAGGNISCAVVGAGTSNAITVAGFLLTNP